MSNQKKYGLIIPKSKEKKATLMRISVFGDDDDDEDEPVNLAKSVKKVGTDAVLKRKTQLEIDKALEQDPSVYEYDAIFDDIQESKLANIPGGKKQKEKDKKPKYIESLLKTAELRKKEHERRLERQVQKEREEEHGQFGDKETFVTGAYRKKMQEMAEEEEKERREAEMEAMLDVTKQKDMSGFYRHLLKQTTGETQGPGVKVEDKSVTELSPGVDYSAADLDASESDTSDSGSSSSNSEPGEKKKDSPTMETIPAKSPPRDKPKFAAARKGNYRRRSSDSDDSSTERHKSRTNKKHSQYRSHDVTRHRKGDRDRHSSRTSDRDSSRTPDRDRHSSRTSDRDRHRSKRSYERDEKHNRYEVDTSSDKHSRGRSKHDDNSRRSKHKEEYRTDRNERGKDRKSPNSRRDLSKNDKKSKSIRREDKSNVSSDDILHQMDNSDLKRKPVEEVKTKDVTVKFAKRNVGDNVEDAKARYLARKQKMMIAISAEPVGDN